MKQYMNPKAELIVFKDEMITAVSGCSCHFDVTKQDMTSIGPSDVGCVGLSGYASENPFGVKAPDWNFGN